MAVVTPEVAINVKDGGIAVVSQPTKRIALAGVCAGGVANQCLHTQDVSAVKATFTSGELVEAGMHVLANTPGVALSLVKIAATSPGVVGAVTTVRAASSTSALSITGTPLDAYEVVVQSMADVTLVSSGDGEIRYSLDGGDTYSNRVALPASGEYEIPGTGLTLAFTTAASLDEGDSFSFSCVAPGYDAAALGAALDALFAEPYEWQVLGVLGRGATVAASAALAATVKTKIEARAASKYFSWALVQAGFGWKNGTITETGSPTQHLTLTGNPTSGDLSFVVEVTTTGGRGAGVFKWSSNGGTSYTENVTIPANGVAALGATGATATFADASYTDGWIYEWTPTPQTNGDMRLAFENTASIRLGVCAEDVELESSLSSGRKYRRGLIYAALQRIAEVPLHEDLGRVKSGPLKGVTAVYDASGAKVTRRDAISDLDAARFITPTTWHGVAGWFISQGNLMCPTGSSFDLHQYIQIMNEACRITHQFLSLQPGDDLRTEPTGAVASEEAEKLDSELKGLLDAALKLPESVVDLSAKIRRDVSLQETRRLQAVVTLVPKGYVKKAEADVGFAITVQGT